MEENNTSTVKDVAIDDLNSEATNDEKKSSKKKDEPEFKLLGMPDEKLHDENGRLIPFQNGTKIKPDLIGDATIHIVRCAGTANRKESGYFVKFQAMMARDGEPLRLVKFNCGSYDAKAFYKDALAGRISFPYRTKVGRDGTSWYFTEHRMTDDHAAKAMASILGL